MRLAVIAREWGRLGAIGFGGPPAHIVLLRKLCVIDNDWLSPVEFEDGIAATNLLPGPASTQLAILCAWKLRGARGALLGGICFIAPGLTIILALSALFLSSDPPLAVLGAAAGVGAAVPAVALHAAAGLVPASWRRAGSRTARRVRWIAYFAIGVLGATLVGPFLVIALVGCGLVEVTARRTATGTRRPARPLVPALVPAFLPTATIPAVGGLAALGWVALKVGALSYGGGFVIIPLMQHDAVSTYHWMTPAQFLDAVALGQITPGPVVQTVAVVGYAAAGIAGGLLAAVVAFAPSFVFVIGGARHLDRLKANASVQAFLTGAGAAAIGAIAGASITLGLDLAHLWQIPVLGLAAAWLLIGHRNVVPALVIAAVIGVTAALAGLPLAH